MYVIRVTILPMIVDPFKRHYARKTARGRKWKIRVNISQVCHFEGKIYSENYTLKECLTGFSNIQASSYNRARF